MSNHSLPRRPVAIFPMAPYYQADRDAAPPVHLRPLTALEQMYAYWGYDRA